MPVEGQEAWELYIRGLGFRGLGLGGLGFGDWGFTGVRPGGSG